VNAWWIEFNTQPLMWAAIGIGAFAFLVSLAPKKPKQKAPTGKA